MSGTYVIFCMHNNYLAFEDIHLGGRSARYAVGRVEDTRTSPLFCKFPLAYHTSSHTRRRTHAKLAREYHTLYLKQT